MKRRLAFLASIIYFIPAIVVQAQSIWNISHLEGVKDSLDDPFYAACYNVLLERADSLLNVEPLSVMMKEYVPASGNKHDYMSLARYTWPDPSKPNGLPYITRDGLTNPEINCFDRNHLGETAQRITTLALAWYFSGNERYAQKAVKLIHTWFLDSATRMNPNLEYAQMVPGHNNGKGRSHGLIDTYSFVEMLDAVALLEKSKAFMVKDSKQLKHWFSRLVDWMLTSKQGVEDDVAINNHSVAYDAQIAAFSLYCGNKRKAREIIEALPEKRIFKQIEPDGRQPHELTRTRSFHYSQYNIAHFIDLLLMAEKLEIDPNKMVSPDGRSVFRAIDFLCKYATDSLTRWPFPQINDRKGALRDFRRELYRAALLLSGNTIQDANSEDKARCQRYLSIYRAGCRLDFSDLFNLVYVRAEQVDNVLSFADGQFRYAIKYAEMARKEPRNAEKRRVTPRSISSDGSLVMVHPHDWCAGFFAGSLWQMYAFSHNDYWRQQAVTWTWPVEEAKWHKGTHDLGFIINNSFGKAYELTGERSYRDVVVQAANTLIKRYNPTTKCIRSWDHHADKWRFPVIIDNMMNLELLFRASQLTGDSVFWKIAVSHANSTLKNHFREDYSSFHVVDYDPLTGKVLTKCTAQGFNDASLWSRGQAWALYGFTMCYRFTHDEKYLKQSERVADFIMGLPNMPDDGIPYWDMWAPSVKNLNSHEPIETVPRDASAAAIMASALYELSCYVPSEKGKCYRNVADLIVSNLNKHYQAERGSHYGFLLLHSVGNFPAGSEIDTSLVYADYYYLEALIRKDKLENGVSVW